MHYSDAVEMAEQSKVGIDVIVETIGGYNVARKVANSALQRGVSLVTANKALLAVHANHLPIKDMPRFARVARPLPSVHINHVPSKRASARYCRLHYKRLR